MISRTKLEMLKQLVSAMEEAAQKLEQAYTEKNTEEIAKLKQEILRLQKKIEQELSV